MNTGKVETETNDAFKLRFDTIYETTELASWDNILCSK